MRKKRSRPTPTTTGRPISIWYSPAELERLDEAVGVVKLSRSAFARQAIDARVDAVLAERDDARQLEQFRGRVVGVVARDQLAAGGTT